MNKIIGKCPDCVITRDIQASTSCKSLFRSRSTVVYDDYDSDIHRGLISL